MRLTGKLGPQEFWAHVDEGDARIRAAVGVLPLFGVDGWTGPRMTGDWGWEDDRLVTAGLAHGDRVGAGAHVHVQSTPGDPAAIAFGCRISAHLQGVEGTDFPAALDRLEADPGTVAVVDVEGVPCEVRLWHEGGHGGGGGWVAAGWHGDFGLVIEASADTDIAQIHLVRVTDVEPYIAGRRAYLHRQRGEDPGL